MEGDGPIPSSRAADLSAAEETPLPGRGPDEAGEDAGGGFFSKIFGRWGRTPAEDELADALENGRGDAARHLSPGRREMIERVIAFDQKRVVDVMAPRADIVAVDADSTLDELVRAFAEAGHSRLPIYRGDLDNPLGMAHIKDVVELIAKPKEEMQPDTPILKQIRREVLYVPPSMRITDLLLKMQASRIHMALVIDEYGGTDGLVTIEDLVEEIVGDINDEHDEDEAPTVTRRPAGGWDADARIELADLAEGTGVEFEVEDDEVDTLGGLVFSLAGRVPQRGEVISHPSGYDFEVTEADARTIRKIRIRPSVGAKDASKSNVVI